MHLEGEMYTKKGVILTDISEWEINWKPLKDGVYSGYVEYPDHRLRCYFKTNEKPKPLKEDKLLKVLGRRIDGKGIVVFDVVPMVKDADLEIGTYVMVTDYDGVSYVFRLKTVPDWLIEGPKDEK